MGDFDPKWFLFSLFGLATAGLHQALKNFYNWVSTQFVSHIEIANDSPAFDYTLQWLQNHPSSGRFRLLSLDKLDYGDPPPDNIGMSPFDGNTPSPKGNKKPVPVMSISSGTHFLWHKRKFLWIHRSRPEGGFLANTVPREILTIKVLARDVSVIKNLVDEIIETAYELTKHCVEVRSSVYQNWALCTTLKPRPPESVVLPEGVLEELVTDCKNFMDSEDWYHSLSIPWRRGYLLHGEPGSGKSITVHVIATILKTNIWHVNLGDKDISDNNLQVLIQAVPGGAIILFEDIDRVQATNKKAENNPEEQIEVTPMITPIQRGVTLSGLLNALDGLTSQEGRLVFMTTNHKNRLDPALIRPGRIDYQQEFGFTNYSQASRFFSRFFPEGNAELNSRFSQTVEKIKITMAELQQILLVHRRHPKLAVEEIEKRASLTEP